MKKIFSTPLSLFGALCVITGIFFVLVIFTDEKIKWLNISATVSTIVSLAAIPVIALIVWAVSKLKDKFKDKVY